MVSFRKSLAILLVSPSSVLVDAWSPQISAAINSHFSRVTGSTTITRLSASSNNNIVLAPSDDPQAFDSLKIGSAKVHRYSVDSDPEGQTEYVMWYHARCVLEMFFGRRDCWCIALLGSFCSRILTIHFSVYSY